MTRSYFISDLHLKSPQDPSCGLFLRFLEACAKAPPTQLFLVGDIFDLWIADREYFVARYSEVIEALTDLKKRGVEIHYFEGNHDLDLSVYWQEQLGFVVHHQAEYFSIAGRVVRVEHGDQMDPEDRGYLFLRWLLRTPALRWLGRHLPGAVVQWIGERASHTSRDYTSHVKVASDGEVRAKILKHVERVRAEREFDIFVSGHVHVPMDATLGATRIFNLGTWLKEPYVLVISESEVALKALTDF